MPRFLVTGGTGFLGRHCVAALAQAGHEVVALSRGGNRPEGATAATACDLLDAEATRAAVADVAASGLVHCAWHDDPRDRWRTPRNLDWLTASLTLARAFADGGGGRMVFAGSCAAYDWRGDPRLSEAETPLRPATLYGAAKASVGVTLAAAADALGISFAEARIFFCYGPGEQQGRLVSDLVAGLCAGRRVACTDGLQRRDFLHAADIGAALALLATSEARGVINVGSGEGVPVRDLVEEVARITGRPELVDLGVLPRPRDDPPCLYADTGQLAALGFRPRFTLSAGLADTVRAWREAAR